jgi:hypothetical protein
MGQQARCQEPKGARIGTPGAVDSGNIRHRAVSSRRVLLFPGARDWAACADAAWGRGSEGGPRGRDALNRFRDDIQAEIPALRRYARALTRERDVGERFTFIVAR